MAADYADLGDRARRAEADLDRANTEAALARDAMAKATTPAPEREAAIRAWEEDATLHRCGSRFDDDDPRATYLMARSEITAAVALMRRAGDPDAKLRELRAWIIDEKWCAPGIVRKIDEMLARPCPEVPETPKIQPSEDREAKIEAWEKEALTVESGEEPFGQGYFILRRSEITEAVALMRSAGDGKALLRELRDIFGRTGYQPGIGFAIDEVNKLLAQPAPVEQPSAAVPDDIGLGPVTDEMVQSGIAAVKDGRWITLEQLRKELAPAPDDTRELVAQLADVAAAFFVSPWGDRARAIAATLRGGA